MARPPKKINWDIVLRKMEAGLKAKQIYDELRINEDTFYDNFKKEFGHSFSDYSGNLHSVGKGNIQYKQYIKALEGNTQMLILLGREWLDQDKLKSDVPPLSDKVDEENRQMSENHRLRKENEELKAKFANQSQTRSEF